MKKRRKNPAAPKNPRSAYLYYVAEQRPIMAKDKRNAKVRFERFQSHTQSPRLNFSLLLLVTVLVY